MRYSTKKRPDRRKLKDETSNGFGNCTKQDQNTHKKYNVEMFSSCIRGGKAYAAEQKIKEF